MTQKEIRIAFPSEDGKKISRHFGKAPYFVVAVLQTDGSVRMEQRARDHWQGRHDSGLIQFGETAEAEGKRSEAVHMLDRGLFAGLEDCQVLVSGGMGQGAYDRAQSQGLQVILTGEWEIDQAVESFRQGTLSSDPRRIHQH